MNPRLFSIAVAIVSFSTIALQLMLTRVFSVTMYYHFAFVVISIALLGIAIAGVAVYLVAAEAGLQKRASAPETAPPTAESAL